MEITAANSKKSATYNQPATGNADSSSDVVEEFSSLLRKMGHKNGSSQSSSDVEFLASLFVQEPSPRVIAEKTAEKVQPEEKEEATETEQNATEEAAVEFEKAAEPQGVRQEKKEAKSEKSEEEEGKEKVVAEEANEETMKEIAFETTSEAQLSTEDLKKIEKAVKQAEAKEQVAIKTDANIEQEVVEITKQVISKHLKAEAAPVEKINEQISLRESIQKIVADSNGSEQKAPDFVDLKLKQMMPEFAPNSFALVQEATKNLIANTTGTTFLTSKVSDAVSGIDASAFKTKSLGEKAEVARQLAQPLTRKDVVQTMQKIEDALKEAIKSKDGKSISLRLDPPQLGAVKVEVTLKEGNLYARVTADSSQVAVMLKDRSSELQQSLRKLGLNVDQVNVFVGHEQKENSDFQNQLKQQSNRSTDRSVLSLLEKDSGALDKSALIPSFIKKNSFESGWVA